MSLNTQLKQAIKIPVESNQKNQKDSSTCSNAALSIIYNIFFYYCFFCIDRIYFSNISLILINYKDNNNKNKQNTISD